jgi:hypothetical protein
VKATRKITVHVEPDLLTTAQKAAKAGVSETVRQGLKLLAARAAYEQLLKMEGKLKVSMDLKRLREDRR